MKRLRGDKSLRRQDGARGRFVVPVDSEQRDFAPYAGSEPADATTRVSPTCPLQGLQSHI